MDFIRLDCNDLYCTLSIHFQKVNAVDVELANESVDKSNNL